MEKIQKISLNVPEEINVHRKFKVDSGKLGDGTIGRLTLQPGWRWSVDVKPMAKTKSCQATHTFYQIAGKTHVRMDDGTEVEYVPGDIGLIPPGHDAWVVGNEPAVSVDFTGGAAFAKLAKSNK